MSKNSGRRTSSVRLNDGDIPKPSLGDDEPGAGLDDCEEQLQFETLIADLSLKFINLPADEIDREIEDSQRRICQCLSLDLCALWQWSAESPRSLVLTHLYPSPEEPPIPESIDAQEYYPWCLQQLRAGKMVAVSSMKELPPEAARDREVCRQWGIKSNLTFPLAAGGGPLIGALGFNATEEERSWPEALVQRLQLVAQIFANAIGRKQSDLVLRESEERLSLATAAAGLGVWMWDISRNEIWATENWRRMFGFSRDAVLQYEIVIGRIHPQDRETVERSLQDAIEGRADYADEYRVVLPDGDERWIAARGRLHQGTGATPARMLGVSMEITQRKRVEQALAERLRFEKLLTDLSATFINLPPDQIDSVIDDSLKKLVATLGHDRSTIAEFAADKKFANVLHSYTVPEFEPFTLERVPDDLLPWYFEQLCQGNTVLFERLEDLPSTAEQVRQFCIAHGIKSHIAIPLKDGGEVLGVINFSSFHHAGYWDRSIISRMQLVGEIFANALMRKRSDETIRAALAENKQLRERLERENVYLREQVTLKHQHGRIIGKSRALKKVLAKAERVADVDTPVLLLGETGTGKELLAQTIHELSARKDRPMVIVNSASLPATLIESELFGREAGAYTGAISSQIGRFEIADGSTLFLDEIGEFPIELQAKLLRVLQDGRFERLGSPECLAVNVRIIAATNRDLEQAMREGKFRADLYHRLNVFPIRMPALHERREDIPLLTWAFVEAFGQRMGKSINSISLKTMNRLQAYAWPGNVRELSNVIERAMILATGNTLHVELPSLGTGDLKARMTLSEGMREQILRVLEDTGWRIRGAGGAAEILALKPTTLEARMAKLGIKRPRRHSSIL